MKSKDFGNPVAAQESRPARALWIEIYYNVREFLVLYVEAREGLVD